MTEEIRMTNIEFLKEHIEQLKQVSFDDNAPKYIVESVEHELSYWQPILNDLLELRSIKESESSDALECLKHIKKDDFNMIIATYPPLPAYNGTTKDEMFNKVEQSLLKAEKLEKAWEVVDEKGVDVGYLKTCKTLEEYNCNCWNEEDYNKKLTQEEFDLLKEMLG